MTVKLRVKTSKLQQKQLRGNPSIGNGSAWLARVSGEHGVGPTWTAEPQPPVATAPASGTPVSELA